MKQKSILVRLLTVVCAVCLCLSMVFGLAACNEETKTVVGVSINNGEIVLEFSDGSKATAGSVKDETCAHENIVEVNNGLAYELDGKDAEKCGAKIYVCKDCDAYIADYTEHDLKDDPTGKAATCASEGWEAGKVCKNCDYTTGKKIEKLPHNWSKAETVYESNAIGTKCEAGYSVLKTCKDCGEVEVEKYEAGKGHKGLYSVAEKPSTTKEGKLVLAACEVCGGSHEIKLPKITETDKYSEIKVIANPLDASRDAIEETIEYSYTLAVPYSEVVDGETVEHENQVHKITDTRNHSVAFGDKTQEVAAQAGVLKIDAYTAEDYATVKIFAGQTYDCTNYAKAHFACETCGGDIEVSVKKAHTIDEEVTTEEVIANAFLAQHGCVYEGEKTCLFPCEDCGANVVEISRKQAGHALSLVEDELKEVTTGEYKGKWQLKFVCKNAGKGCKGLTAQEQIKYVEKSSLTFVDATCEAKGSVTYVDAVTGEKAFAELTKLDHSIGTKDGKAVRISSGATIDVNKYADFVANINTFVGKDLICGGATVAAYFECADCGASVDINAYRSHKYVKQVVTQEGSCTEDKITRFTCAFADCEFADAKVAADETKATWGTLTSTGKHTFEFVSYDADTNTLIVKCVAEAAEGKADCTIKNVEKTASNVVATAVTGENCGEDGTKFTFKYDGKDYELFKANDTHIFNGKKIASGAVILEGTEGLKILSGKEPTSCLEAGRGEGYIVCERCGGSVAVAVNGTHKVPYDAEGKIVLVPATCIEAEHYVCDYAGCDEKTYTANKATGHDYVLATAEFATLPAALTIKCDDCGMTPITLNIAAADFEGQTKKEGYSFVEGCTVDTYTVALKVADYAGLDGNETEIPEKTITLKFTVKSGEHDWLADKNGKAILCVWTEQNGGTHYVAGFYCTRCNKMIVAKRVDATTTEGKKWVVEGAFDREFIATQVVFPN
ncbi:MAG: hypothetical protein E7340_03825 [Clostridiales bacterium]|nr:hypothetical protein [Clostridiales bacterium]